MGSDGSLNDINVLDSSNLASAILEGSMLPDFKFEVVGRMLLSSVSGRRM